MSSGVDESSNARRATAVVEMNQLARFLVVGLSAVGTDFLTYMAMVNIGGLPTTPSKIVSFVAGAVISFILNRSFVFRADASPASRQAAEFAFLYATTLGLNAGVNAFSLDLGCAKSFAWLIATGASTVANFAGMKWIVFRSRNVDS